MTDSNRQLPLDPDLEAVDDSIGRSRAVHLSPANIGLVAGGGAAGTGLRYWISAVLPHWAGVPVATLGINLVGAFLLGVLLELLAESSPDSGWSRRMLSIGTGGLGGFTTYSALATDTVTLAAAHPWRSAGYALTTVIVGAMASLAGIWLARRNHHPTSSMLVTRTRHPPSLRCWSVPPAASAPPPDWSSTG